MGELPAGMRGRVVLAAADYARSRRPWLAARRQGLGASEVAAVLGLSDYATPLDVWLDKTSTADPADEPPSEAALWGNRLERAIADEFRVRHSRRLGVKVLPTPGLLAHEHHPWMLATVDRVLVHRRDGSFRCPLEIKTAGTYAAKEWGDEPPLKYRVQVQVQLAVTGADHGLIVPLFAGQKMPAPWRVDRDDEAIAAIVEHAGAWWRQHVVGGVMPDPTARDVSTLAAVWPEADDTEAVLDDSLVDRLRLRARITRRIRDLEAARDRVDAAVKAAMGPAKKATTPDGVVAATWSRYPVRRLDVDAFKADHPDLHARYLRETRGQRFTAKIKEDQ